VRWVCRASAVNSMPAGSCPAARRSVISTVSMGISLVLAGIARCASTTAGSCSLGWVQAASRCGAGRSPSRAPRTVLPSTATGVRPAPGGGGGSWAAVQAATTASRASRSTVLAIRRMVASLGAVTCPVSGSGTAPRASSSARPAPAAHCAAPTKDSNPALAMLITSTPSTHPVGCRRAPPGRGSGTARTAVSRPPAPPAGAPPGADVVAEDEHTGTAPADDDWLRHRDHQQSRARPRVPPETRRVYNKPVTSVTPAPILDVTGPWGRGAQRGRRR